MDTDQLADADFARACELSSDLRELVEKESCTQGKLMDALLLKRKDVHQVHIGGDKCKNVDCQRARRVVSQECIPWPLLLRQRAQE